MAYDLGLAERVRSILKERGGFSECKMFGCIAFMINGHMCCGVMKTDLFLRLSPEGAVTARGQRHTRPMDSTGKRMKSMILVDAQGTASDQTLQEWVESAFAVVRTLPPKNPLAKSPRGASRSSRKRRYTRSR
ncbi:MAG: TfoX/Sxy family protein [Bryobacteraceae bacterium]